MRLVCKDYNSSYDELILKDNFFRIHHRNLQKLASEIVKVELGFAPEVMKNVFSIIENSYNLRNETKFKSRNVPTVRYRTETVAPRSWRSIPRSYKQCSSANEVLKQKLNFDIQETAHANFAKITSVKQIIHITGYMSFVDASVICESIFLYEYRTYKQI